MTIFPAGEVHQFSLNCLIYHDVGYAVQAISPQCVINIRRDRINTIHQTLNNGNNFLGYGSDR